MKTKITFIVISVLATIGLITFMTISNQQKNYKQFTKDGYILSEKLSGTVETNVPTTFYFNSGTKYKSNYNENITFKDINGDNVTTNNNMFVHYSDGSVSVLKKSVIINTEDITNSVLKYYNVFEKSIIQKTGDSYYIDNLGKKLKFDNFILKISDTKYLIASKNLKLNLEENENLQANEYIELEFTEGGMVKLANQSVTYQTISSNSNIEINNKYILKFEDKGIYENNERIFTLDQMVINSDDNIEITPLEEKNEEYNNPDIVPPEQNNNSDANQNVDVDNNEEEVENQKTYEPVFTIEKFENTSNSVNAFIKISDNYSTLRDEVITKVIENSTGNVVLQKKDLSGVFNYNISFEGLTPETTYTMISTAHYEIEGQTYEKNFITKAFRTDSIGITVEKDYYTDSELSFNIKSDTFSKVTGAHIYLLDANKKVLKDFNNINLQNVGNDGYNVKFNDLKSNTKYYLYINQFVYNGMIISNNFEIQKEAITLKTKPIVNSETNSYYKINKNTSSFTLSIDDLQDKDKGIISYRYEVYSASSFSNDEIIENPVKIIDSSSIAPVTLNVESSDNENCDSSKQICRNNSYRFRVVITFFDNEKYIEYIIPPSEELNMGGKDFPIVSFLPSTEIHHEAIKGIIIITDKNNTIPRNDPNVIITYSNSLGTIVSDNYEGKILDLNNQDFEDLYNVTLNFNPNDGITRYAILFDKNNLRSNSTYDISVYAKLNVDANTQIEQCYIGSVIVNTVMPDPIPVVAERKDNNNLPFDFKINFSNVIQENGADVEVNREYEASTLKGITFKLYEGEDNDKSLVAQKSIGDEKDNPYESSISDQGYSTAGFSITPEFFDKKESEINTTGDKKYTIVIEDAFDYTKYENNIPIITKENTKEIVFTPNKYVPKPDTTVNNVTVLTITNGMACATSSKYSEGCDTNLLDSTVIGYEIKPSNITNNEGFKFKNITYSIYKYINGVGTIITDPNFTNEIEITDEKIPSKVYYLNNDTDFKRGEVYYFVYNAELEIEGVISLYNTSEKPLKSSDISSPKQEPQIQMYPYKLTESEYVWKYKLTDIDSAIVKIDNMIQLRTKSNGIISDKNINISKDDFSTVNFNVNQTPSDTHNRFEIYLKQKVLNDEINKTIVFEYTENIMKNQNYNYRYQKIRNNLEFQLIDYSSNSFYRKITAYKINFTYDNGRNSLSIDNVLPDTQGNIIINLANYEELIGKTNIVAELEAYVDSGKQGFEPSSEYYTLQKVIENRDIYDNYIILTKNNNNKINATTSETPLSGLYKFKELNSKNLILSNYDDSIDYSLPIKYESSGIFSSIETIQSNITLKPVELRKGVNSAENKTFDFTSVIPGAELDANNGIYTTLDEVGVNLKFYKQSDTIEGNKLIYVFKKIYTTGKNTCAKSITVNPESLVTITNGIKNTNTIDIRNEDYIVGYDCITLNINIDDLVDSNNQINTLKLKGLEVNTEYEMSLYTRNLQENGEYKEQNVIDIEIENDFKKEFKTLVNVTFTEMNAKYIASSYNNKKISLEYKMDQTTGFYAINYEIYRIIKNSDGTISRAINISNNADTPQYINNNYNFSTITEEYIKSKLNDNCINSSNNDNCFIDVERKGTKGNTIFQADMGKTIKAQNFLIMNGDNPYNVFNSDYIIKLTPVIKIYENNEQGFMMLDNQTFEFNIRELSDPINILMVSPILNTKSNEIVYRLNFLNRDDDKVVFNDGQTSHVYIKVQNSENQDITDKFGLATFDTINNKMNYTYFNSSMSYMQQEISGFESGKEYTISLCSKINKNMYEISNEEFTKTVCSSKKITAYDNNEVIVDEIYPTIIGNKIRLILNNSYGLSNLKMRYSILKLNTDNNTYEGTVGLTDEFIKPIYGETEGYNYYELKNAIIDTPGTYIINIQIFNRLGDSTIYNNGFTYNYQVKE